MTKFADVDLVVHTGFSSRPPKMDTSVLLCLLTSLVGIHAVYPPPEGIGRNNIVKCI